VNAGINKQVYPKSLQINSTLRFFAEVFECNADVNGDKLSDLVIASRGYNTSPLQKLLVVYGSKEALPYNFDLESLNGTNGFNINGKRTNVTNIPAAVIVSDDLNGVGITEIVSSK
jgi:hypothetical protein